MTIMRKASAKKRRAKKAGVRKPATKKALAKKRATSKRKPNAAFMKAIQPDAALAAVIGGSPLPRTEVTKKIWNYIKKNNLQANKNERLILPATVEPRYLTRAQIQFMVKSVRKP